MKAIKWAIWFWAFVVICLPIELRSAEPRHEIPRGGVKYKGEIRSPAWVLTKFTSYKAKIGKTCVGQRRFLDLQDPDIQQLVLRVTGVIVKKETGKIYVVPSSTSSPSMGAKEKFAIRVFEIGKWHVGQSVSGIVLEGGSEGGGWRVASEIINPISQKDFVEVLRSGFELIQWKSKKVGGRYEWLKYPDY